MREVGQISGRNRFKRRAGSGNPVWDQRLLVPIFADESGVPRLTRANSDTTFVLAAIAISEAHAGQYARDADRMKREFGLSNVVLHEPHMSRHDRDFFFDGDRNKQEHFVRAVDELIERTEFTAFSVGLRKHAFAREYVSSGQDPFLPRDFYGVAVQLLLERLVEYIAGDERYPLGHLTFESRGPKEDVEVQRFVAETLHHGTRWVSEAAFRRYLKPGVEFRPKQSSHPLELADLLARTVFEWVNSDCTREPRRWPLFGAKWYRRGDLRMGKFGLKVFPDSDVSQQVEAHRNRLRRK